MSQQSRKPVRVRRVDQCNSVHEIFEHCLPAFGGAILRRVYTILDRAIEMGCPITMSIAGPVTVSGQHQSWLIPLLETGWVAYISTTDAVCYHDGHRSLDGHRDPIHEVPIASDDTELRYRLGAHYAAQEKKNDAPAGLLSTCQRLAIPVFVGAPADGSVFLNSMKLWAMKQTGLISDYAFDLDLHAEVF